jgi:hypothetical protein
MNLNWILWQQKERHSQSMILIHSIILVVILVQIFERDSYHNYPTNTYAPLFKQYASPYNVVNKKQVSVTDVLGNNPLNVIFRRMLTPNK